MAIPTSTLSRLRRAAYAGGAILCVASLGFVAWALGSQFERISDLDLLELRFGPIALAAVLYGASLITTAFAWPILVDAPYQGVSRLMIIGLASQVAKYVPGSFANYLGRSLIAQRHSVGLKRSVATTVVELGSSIVAGMIVGIVSISESKTAVSIVSRNALQLQLLAALILIVFFLFARRERNPFLVTGSTLIFIVSFLLAGASFYVLSLAFIGQAPLELTFAIASFAFAWIAGFVVVGAPAGLGIREAVLAGLLTPSLGIQFAVLLAAMHRLVTIGVDLTMGIAANYLLWRTAGRGQDG